MRKDIGILYSLSNCTLTRQKSFLEFF